MAQKEQQYTAIERVVAGVGSVPSLIVHTIAFASSFALGVFGIAPWEIILLVLTTVVSLEAIYLAIFIQMSVNRNTASLLEVEHDIEEISEDVEDISEEVEDIQEDLEEISEDIEEISEDDERDEARNREQTLTLDNIMTDVRKLLEDIENLKRK